ncbi:MAG: 1-phosphofructokinase family hexose kinase [Myxococcota bacterium]|nr:1-phosphofructokinase family hexose kinase [Myxococcota bacterium]
MAAIVTVTMNPAIDVSFEVERMVAESKLRATAPELHPGGGGINVARAAARLGGDVMALWMGGGCDGARLAELLGEEHVPYDRVPAADEPRLSIHVEERTTGAMYRFVLPGPTITPQEAKVLEERIASYVGARFLVLSGSLPPSLPTDYYAELAARAPRGVRVILDTSGEPLTRGLAGHVYLAKPNRNELGRAVGRELATIDDVVRAARALIDDGRVELLAVSLGAEGMVLVTRDDADHIRAPQVRPISAVGAGDSTVAGIVVGLARGLPIADAMRLGVAAGAAAVLTPGTELSRREDTDRLYAELQAERCA